jgi:hypothetical protein
MVIISSTAIVDNDIKYMQNNREISILDISSNINKDDNYFYYQILHGGCSCDILDKEYKLQNAIYTLLYKYIKFSNLKVFIYEDIGGWYDINYLYEHIKNSKIFKTSFEDFMFSFYSSTLSTEKVYIINN